MCYYGVGNHGGGPTKGNIEYILENKHSFAGAELRFSTPQAYFDAVAPRRESLPIVGPAHELQGVFPGCYVVMQDVKRLQRHAEHRMVQAQHAVDHFADNATKKTWTQRIDEGWEDLLFTEFHDILAGTSIPAAWGVVRDMQGRACLAAEEAIVNVTRRYARQSLPPVNHQQIAMFNPDDQPFAGYVEHEPFLDFDHWNDRWLADAEGNSIPFQFVQAQSTIMLSPALVFPVQLGAHGVKVITLRDAPCPTSDDGGPPMSLRVEPTLLANDHVTLHLHERGIAQISCAGHNLLGSEGLTLHMQDDTADTWGFQINRFAGDVSDKLAGCVWVVEESGPMRARVRTEARIGESHLRWTLTLHHDRPAVDMLLEVNFAERFKLLRMPIHLAKSAERWRRGLAGGAVNQAEGDMEWPLQGWAYATPSAGDSHALAVITQDANSASLWEGRLSWAMLRATRMAWAGSEASLHTGRDTFTDQGVHTFAMQLLPLPADAINDATLDHAASHLARPLVVFDRYDGLSRPPWGNSPPRRLWTPAEHRARADGRMMHLADEGGASVEE